MNGPPPAYSPSPEPTSSATQEPSQPSPLSQSTQPSQPSPITYNTFPEQHLERGFLPRREEPESMGSPEELPNESTPLSRRYRSRSRSPCRNILRKLLLVALVFTVTTTLLTTIFRGLQSVSYKASLFKERFPPHSAFSQLPSCSNEDLTTSNGVLTPTLM
jgi:hypothetical protein